MQTTMDFVHQPTLFDKRSMLEMLVTNDKYLICGMIKLSKVTIRGKRDGKGFNWKDEDEGIILASKLVRNDYTDKDLQRCRKIIAKYSSQLATFANIKIKKRGYVV